MYGERRGPSSLRGCTGRGADRVAILVLEVEEDQEAGDVDGRHPDAAPLVHPQAPLAPLPVVPLGDLCIYTYTAKCTYTYNNILRIHIYCVVYIYR